MTTKGTKGATAVMGRSVRCVLTITALLGAMLYAGPAQADSDEYLFLPLNEAVNGIATDVWANEVVSASAVLGAIPATGSYDNGTGTYSGPLVDGEDGWVEAQSLNINTIDRFGLLKNKSALGFARGFMAASHAALPTQAVKMANLTQGDSIILCAVAMGIEQASVTAMKNGTSAAAAGVLTLVTADFGASAAETSGVLYGGYPELATNRAYLAPNLAGGIDGSLAAYANVYPNFATPVSKDATDTVLFLWDGTQSMTNMAGNTLGAASFTIGATNTTTSQGLSIAGIAFVNTVTGTDNDEYASTLVGIDHHGPGWTVTAGGTLGNADQFVESRTWGLDRNGVNIKRLVEQNWPELGTDGVDDVTTSVEFKAYDYVIYNATITTNCLYDGEPDIYFRNGALGTDPLNEAVGTNLIGSKNSPAVNSEIIKSISVTPYSIVPTMQDSDLNNVSAWQFTLLNALDDWPSTLTGNDETQDEQLYSNVLGASVIVDSSLPIAAFNFNSTDYNNNEFYSQNLVFSASFIVKDVSTPNTDYGNLTIKAYFGDELGLGSTASTVGLASNGTEVVVVRRVDTRPPAIVNADLANVNFAVNGGYNSYVTSTVQPIAAGGTKRRLVLQMGVDLNGDKQSDKDAYIASCTDTVGLVTVADDSGFGSSGLASHWAMDWNGGNPAGGTGAITMIPLSASNTSIGHAGITLERLQSGAGTLDGASFTEYLDVVSSLGPPNVGADYYNALLGNAAAADPFNAALIIYVTDDARNTIVYNTAQPPASDFPTGGLTNKTPALSTFAIDFVSPVIQNVTAGFMSFFPGDTTVDGATIEYYLRNFAAEGNKQGPEDFDSLHYSPIAAPYVRVVTYGAPGTTIDMYVTFDPSGGGTPDNGHDSVGWMSAIYGSQYGKDGGTALTGWSGSSTDINYLGINNTKGMYSISASIGAHDRHFGAGPPTSFSHRTIEYSGSSITIVDSTAAWNLTPGANSGIAEATAHIRMTLPTSLFGTVTDADGVANQLAYLPGGVSDASMIVKLADRMGYFDGAINATEAVNNPAHSASEFSNFLMIQTQAPLVGALTANNAIIRTVTANSASALWKADPHPIDPKHLSQTIVLVTSTDIIANGLVDPFDGLTGTNADNIYTYPQLFSGAGALLNAADTDASKIRSASMYMADDPPTGANYNVTTSGTMLWDNVQIGDTIVVCATIVPPTPVWAIKDGVYGGYSGFATGTVDATLTQYMSPFANEFSYGDTTTGADIELVTYEAVKTLITADFSDFVTDNSAKAVIPKASKIIRGGVAAGDNGLTLTNNKTWIGQAGLTDIVLVTFVYKLDPTLTVNNDIHHTAKNIRSVTITARSPLGPAHSAAIRVATNTNYSDVTVSLAEYKIAKKVREAADPNNPTYVNVSSLSATTNPPATVAVDDKIQVVAIAYTNDTQPDATNGNPKNFIGLDLSQFLGFGDQQMVAPDTVTVSGPFSEAGVNLGQVDLGSAGGLIADVITSSSPIYATWTVSLTDTGIATETQSASIAVAVTSAANVVQRAVSASLVQVDLNNPTIADVKQTELSTPNSNFDSSGTLVGTSDTLSDEIIRPLSTVRIVATFEGDNADNMNANTRVVSGYTITPNLNSMNGTILTGPSVVKRAGLQTIDATYTATVDPNKTLSSNPTPQLANVTVIVTDAIGNGNGPFTGTPDLYIDTEPPAPFNTAEHLVVRVSNVVRLRGPAGPTAPTEDPDTNVVLDLAASPHWTNADHGEERVYFDVPAGGHKESISPGDYLYVHTKINEGEDMALTDLSDTALDLTSYGLGLIPADAEAAGFPSYASVDAFGITRREINWTITIPDTVVTYDAPVTSTDPAGATVVIRVTDTADLSSATVDDTTIEIDNTPPSVTANFNWIDRYGNTRTDVVSGVNTSTAYATFTAQVVATYTGDYPSTLAVNDAAQPIANPSAMISLDASSYGINNVTPNIITFTGSGPTVEGGSSTAEIKKSTNTVVTVIYAGNNASLPSDGSFTGVAGAIAMATNATYYGLLNASYNEAGAAIGLTTKDMVPGNYGWNPSNNTNDSNASAQIILKVSDRVGNQTTITGSPELDNSPPSFINTMQTDNKVGPGTPGGATITAKSTNALDGRVGQNSTIELEFGIYDTPNNTTPIDVAINLGSFMPTGTPTLAYVNVATGTTPTIAEYPKAPYYRVAGIEPLSGEEAGAAKVSLTFQISDDAATGLNKGVSMSATDSINIWSALIDSTGLNIDNTAPLGASQALNDLGSGALVNGDNYAVQTLVVTQDATGNITIVREALQPPSVGPGDLVLVSATVVSDTVQPAAVGCDIESRLNIGAAQRIDAASVTTGAVQVQSNGKIGSVGTLAYGKENVWWVTALVPVRVDADPIQPQDFGLTVRDEIGNTLVITDTLGVNAVGVVINSAVIYVNDVMTDGTTFGNIGPGFPDGSANECVDELGVGDRVKVYAEIALFDTATPIDQQLTLDADCLYNQLPAGTADAIVPSSTDRDVQSDVLTAWWEYSVLDFDGAGTNPAAIRFADFTLAGGAANPPVDAVGNATLLLAGSTSAADFIYANGLGWVTTTFPILDASGAVTANGVNVPIYDAPYLSVQPNAYSVERATLTITAQDADAANPHNFPAAQVLTVPVSIDNNPPVANVNLKPVLTALPSGDTLTVETNGVNTLWPETPNMNLGPNRISASWGTGSNKLQAVVEMINPRIHFATETNRRINAPDRLITNVSGEIGRVEVPDPVSIGFGDDKASTLTGGYNLNTQDIISQVTMDLSAFGGSSFSNVLADDPSAATWIAEPTDATATVFVATWTVTVDSAIGTGAVESRSSIRYGEGFRVGLYDDVGNPAVIVPYDTNIAIDNNPPSISTTGLAAMVKSGTATTPSGNTVTTTGSAIPNRSKMSAGSVINVSAPITESVDSPNDILQGQFGNVSLDVTGLSGISAADITLSTIDSTVSANVLFAFFEVTLPDANETTGSTDFRFIVSATDTVGNTSSVTTSNSYQFDGKPSIMVDNQTVVVDAGQALEVVFNATDIGKVEDVIISLVTGSNTGVTLTPGAISGQGTDVTRAVTINTTVGDDIDPIQIGAYAIDQDALLSDVVTATININQPALVSADEVTLATIEEGDSLVVNVTGLDKNIADTISIEIGGTILTSTEVLNVSFNTPSSVNIEKVTTVSGTGGSVLGQLIFEPGYLAIGPYAQPAGNATSTTYTISFTSKDGVGTDPDDTYTIDVNVFQNESVPEVVITSLKVGGVAKDAGLGTVSVPEGATIEIDVTATDTSGEIITLATQSGKEVTNTFTTTPAVGTTTATYVFSAGYFDAGTDIDPFTISFIAFVPADSDNDGDIDADDEMSSRGESLIIDIVNVSQPPIVTITDANGAAVEDGATINVVPNSSLVLNVTASDADGDLVFVDPPSLTPDITGISVSTNPTTIANVGTANGVVTVAIGAVAENATTVLQIVGRDNTSQTPVNINLNINVADSAPTITADPTTATITQGATTSFAITSVDAQGDAITLSDDSANGVFESELQAGGTKTASYVFTGNAVGTESIVLTASANGLSASTTITVTVQAAGPTVTTGGGIAVGTGQGAAKAGFQIFNVSGGAFDQPGLTNTTSATCSVLIAAGDLTGGGYDEVITGGGVRYGYVADSKKNGSVTVFDSVTRSKIAGLVPFPVAPAGTINDFDNNPTGEIRVAAGNVIGNASEEIIMVQGAGAQSRLRFSHLVNGTLTNIDANTFRPGGLGNPDGGINVAVGDFDGDALAEVVCAQVGAVTTIAQGGPFDFAAHIQALNILDAANIEAGATIPPASVERSKIRATFGLSTNPSGGIRLAAGDLNTDSKDELVVVSASVGATNGGNRIAIMTSNLVEGTITTELAPFAVANNISFALFGSGSNPSGNIYVSVANMDDDAQEEIVVGRGENAANEVLVYDVDMTKTGSAAFTLKSRFVTYSTNAAGGTHVAAGNFAK